MNGNIIKNNIIIDPAKWIETRLKTFTDYLPKPLIGNHLVGDECWCQPEKRHIAGTLIFHRNPKLLVESVEGKNV